MPNKVIYKHHKRIDNALHKAAFRCRIDKINSLLLNQRISPYKTTSEAETPLHLSLSGGHQNAANIFLKILEIDLIAVRQYLSEHGINVRLNNENFAVALGEEQMQIVDQNLFEIMVQPKDGEEVDKCSFILMKEHVFAVPNVLAFRPNDQSQKFLLLSIVFRLLKKNGVVSVNVQQNCDRSTVLHLAAARGDTVMVMRLLDLGANPYLKDNAHQTAIGAAHSMGQFPTYVEMCRRLDLNMFATKDFVTLQVANAVWENVEFLIETLATLRMENYQENRDKAIKTVLSMNEIAGTFLLSDIGGRCLEKYGECLPEKKLAKIIMLLVNDNSVSKWPCVMRNILQNSEIVKEKTSRVIQYRTHNTLLHSLVRNSSDDIVRKIYDEFPRSKTLLFEHKELGLSALTECIRSNHIGLAKYLIEAHEDEIDRPEQWSQLLIAAAEPHVSIDFVKMILDHRLCNPNLVLHGVKSIQTTNALFVCIARADLEKVKVIIESSKLTDFNAIQSNFKETLLQCAICGINVPSSVGLSSHDDRSRFEQFECLTNDDPGTSEDENEPSAVQETMIAESNDGNLKKYETMNKIFELLAGKGANVKHIDSSHRTLLHHAVERSNKYVVERLLQLGLDPIDPDINGNVALHFVSKGTSIKDVQRRGWMDGSAKLDENRQGMGGWLSFNGRPKNVL